MLKLRHRWWFYALGLDRSTHFTSGDYQQFLADRNIFSSMSALGHCADNAAAEGFFGMIKRERIRLVCKQGSSDSALHPRFHPLGPSLPTLLSCDTSLIQENWTSVQ